MAISVAAALTAAPPPAAHAAANPAPAIIPALQSWTGGDGTFAVGTSSRIVADAGLEEVAGQFAADLASITGVRAEVLIGADAGPDDLVLDLDPDLAHEAGGVRFDEEGYLLEVTAAGLEVSAPTSDGAFYGTRTVLQALMQSPGRDTVPVGESFDWPSHEVRGFMLDVGRRFFTPEFVRDYITMMSWYKLNQFQIHLNDNEIQRPAGGWVDAYDGFRLQTENPAFAGLASEDGAYDRDDWQSFENTASSHAVQIIPEIDVPAHSRSFIRWKPELGFNGGDSDHLDLSKPETTATIKAVFDEFIPWFEGPDVHFGADEYPRHLADDYRTFFNDMAAHVRSHGKHPRAWGSMSVMHGSAEGYDRDVTINSWNNGWYGMATAEADGYDYINTNDGDLYVVPFAGYYHGHGLNNQGLYNSWLPNKLGSTVVVPAGAPEGAMFAVWNDLVHEDYTELDVHGLMRDSFPVIAQKTWNSAPPTASYAAFTDVLAQIGRGPDLTVIEQSSGVPAVGEISLGAAVTASASNDGNPAGALVDGRELTRWATSEDTARFSLDLGTAQAAGRIEVDWAAPAPVSFDVEVSEDGTFWQRIADDVDGDTTSVQLGAVTARFVAVTDIRSADGADLSAWRAAVFTPLPLTASATATASGAEAPSFPPSLAIDGNDATRWSADYSATPWIAVDLGAAEPFDTIELAWEAASARSFTVETSLDGTSWQAVAARQDLPAGARTDTVTFEPVTARHVRVTVTAKNLTPYLSLFELTIPSIAEPRATLTARVEPTAPDGADGWYVTEPAVSITAHGTAGAAGDGEYRLNDGPWTELPAGAVSIEEQGEVRIDYRANVGDVPVEGYGTLRIDTLAPEVEIVAAAGSTPAEPVEVRFEASDAGIGVERVEYLIDDGEWAAWSGEPLIIAEPGEHLIQARGVDRLGHVSDVVTAEVEITELGVTIDGDAPSFVRKGRAFELQVTGAQPGAEVRAELASGSNSTSIRLGTASANADGTATITATLPAKTRAGDYDLVVVVTDTAGAERELRTALTVTNGPKPPKH